MSIKISLKSYQINIIFVSENFKKDSLTFDNYRTHPRVNCIFYPVIAFHKPFYLVNISQQGSFF